MFLSILSKNNVEIVEKIIPKINERINNRNFW
jgi:hypothetical protein